MGSFLWGANQLCAYTCVRAVLCQCACLFSVLAYLHGWKGEKVKDKSDLLGVRHFCYEFNERCSKSNFCLMSHRKVAVYE